MLEIKNTVATLYYDIDFETAREFCDWISENKNATELVLFIDCVGGINSAARKMVKAINNFEGIFTTINTGTCASAAVDIFLAGNRRFATPSVDFMIHKVVLIVPNDCIMTISEMQGYLKKMIDETAQTFRYIERRCGLTCETLLEKTADSVEWHFDEKTALEYNIISDVIEEIMPTKRKKK